MSDQEARSAAWTPHRHDGKLVVRGSYLDDIRTRAEGSRTAECARTACLEPEANELAEIVLGLLDVIEGLDRAYLEAVNAAI
jgi:hypothetical protein